MIPARITFLRQYSMATQSISFLLGWHFTSSRLRSKLAFDLILSLAANLLWRTNNCKSRHLFENSGEQSYEEIIQVSLGISNYLLVFLSTVRWKPPSVLAYSFKKVFITALCPSRNGTILGHAGDDGQLDTVSGSRVHTRWVRVLGRAWLPSKVIFNWDGRHLWK